MICMLCPTSIVGLGALMSTRATEPFGVVVPPSPPPPPQEAATTTSAETARERARRELLLKRDIQIPEGRKARAFENLRDLRGEMQLSHEQRAGWRFVTGYVYTARRQETGDRGGSGLI